MPVKRVFAHKIIYCGKEYRNHVAEITDNGEVVLYPFESEIAMTLFTTSPKRAAGSGPFLISQQIFNAISDATIPIASSAFFS